MAPREGRRRPAVSLALRVIGVNAAAIAVALLFAHSAPVYGALLLVPLVWFLLEKTSWGLSVKAAGQNPVAADSLGVDVVRVRYLSVIAGSALAGMAGAALSTGILRLFQENLTAGQGFIAVMLPYLITIAALAFTSHRDQPAALNRPFVRGEG